MALSMLAMRVLTIIGVLCGVVAIFLSVTSLAHHGWLAIKYEAGTASTTSNNWLENSRQRGIFFECLDESVSSPKFPENSEVKISFSNCIDLDIGQYTHSNEDSNFSSIIALRLAQIVIHLLAVALNLIELILSVVILWRWFCYKEDTNFRRKARITIASLLLFSAVFLMISAVLFIVLTNNEKDSNKSTSELKLIYSSWPKTTQNQSTLSYGVMFILCWIAFGLNLIGAILIYTTVCTIPEDPEVGWENALRSNQFVTKKVDIFDASSPFYTTQSQSTTLNEAPPQLNQ